MTSNLSRNARDLTLDGTEPEKYPALHRPVMDSPVSLQHGTQNSRSGQQNLHCSCPDKHTPRPPCIWDVLTHLSTASTSHDSMALCPLLSWGCLCSEEPGPGLKGGSVLFLAGQPLNRKAHWKGADVGVVSARDEPVIAVQPATSCYRAVFQGLNHCPARGTTSATR